MFRARNQTRRYGTKRRTAMNRSKGRESLSKAASPLIDLLFTDCPPSSADGNEARSSEVTSFLITVSDPVRGRASFARERVIERRFRVSIFHQRRHGRRFRLDQEIVMRLLQAVQSHVAKTEKCGPPERKVTGFWTWVGKPVKQ